MQQFNFKPIISAILVMILGFTLVVVLGKVLIPFIAALILAYIINPLVEKIHRRFHIKRSFIALLFSLLIFLLFLIIPLFIIPTVAMQLKSIIDKIPDLIGVFNHDVLQLINNKYGTSFAIDLDSLKDFLLNNVGEVYNNVNIYAPIAKNSFVIIETIVYIILIPFVLFYAINDWHKILGFFDQLIPRSYSVTAHKIIADIDHLMSAYLRGQLSVMLIMASYYAIALHLIHLTSGIMIGVFTGLLVFVPYLGILTGLVLSLTVSFAAFSGLHQLAIVCVVFVIGHILEGGLVTPFLVGGKIGLNPVMIILALMVFGKAFGIVGVLLALPLSTIAVVLLKHAKIYYQHTDYYNE